MYRLAGYAVKASLSPRESCEVVCSIFIVGVDSEQRVLNPQSLIDSNKLVN
jgi:hypothetical protein